MANHGWGGVLLIFIGCLFLIPFSGPADAAVEMPVLKWQHGGCYSSWCETGWYSSPVVADLDGDGDVEVIAGSYSVFIINGTDGSLIRRIQPDGGPDLAGDCPGRPGQ